MSITIELPPDLDARVRVIPDLDKRIVQFLRTQTTDTVPKSEPAKVSARGFPISKGSARLTSEDVARIEGEG